MCFNGFDPDSGDTQKRVCPARGRRIDANKAITSYDRSTIASDIAQAAADGRLLYLDKKRSQNIFAGRPGANSLVTMRESDFENRLRDFWAGVKWEKEGKTEYSSGTDDGETQMTKAFRDAEERKADEETKKKL